MELIIGILAATVFALAFKKPLKAAPWAFYLLAFAVDVVFLSKCLVDIAPEVSRLLHPYMQRCIFPFGLFTVVMFLGALPESSQIRRYLAPVRSHLSVFAGILAAGHFANYLDAYFSKFLAGTVGVKLSLLLSFVTSAALLALLIVLVITSLYFVRQKMDPKTWAKVQRLAYLFYGLIYVHLCLVLVPTLGTASQKSLVALVVYTAVFLLYAVLRARKAFADRRDPYRSV